MTYVPPAFHLRFLLLLIFTHSFSYVLFEKRSCAVIHVLGCTNHQRHQQHRPCDQQIGWSITTQSNTLRAIFLSISTKLGFLAPMSVFQGRHPQTKKMRGHSSTTTLYNASLFHPLHRQPSENAEFHCMHANNYSSRPFSFCNEWTHFFMLLHPYILSPLSCPV